MARNILFALTLAVYGSASAGATPSVTFSLREPVTIAGIPSVTLGPGTYVLRKVDRAVGANVVQVLSQHRDYLYTTLLAIPVTRPQADDRRQFVFAETPSGGPPTLRVWFPPGETLGHEFVTPVAMLAPQHGSANRTLQKRADPALQSAADLYALHEPLQRIESGKFSSARDLFKRNYFLAESREGAMTSFLLALLMIDPPEAKASLDLVRRLDPGRARMMSRLEVNNVLETLPVARKNLKGSLLRRFLLNFALESCCDDTISRTAVLAFERHVLHGDSFPVEMALDRRREELAKRKTNEERWILAKEQIERLNDCVKSLLNKVGALHYSAVLEARPGAFGSVKLSIVLNRRRLEDLDSIMELSHKTICGRQSNLERLIARRHPVVVRELESLRMALRELDRKPGSTTRSQYAHIRDWHSARPSEVSHDLMALAETAKSPLMRPSIAFRTDPCYLQMNIAGSLAMLAEWAGL